jgi:hypothetical protein
MRAVAFASQGPHHNSWRAAYKVLGSFPVYVSSFNVVAMQSSGLGDVIDQITRPGTIITKHAHAQELFSKNHLQETLGCIVTKWTLKDIVRAMA